MEQDLTKIIHELSIHETQLKTELDQLTTRTKVTFRKQPEQR